MTVLLKKIKEALMSVLPVAAIVVLLNLTPLVHFTGLEIGVFLVSAVFLILGIGLFSMGADMAMTPMGEYTGAGLTKSKSSFCWWAFASSWDCSSPWPSPI